MRSARRISALRARISCAARRISRSPRATISRCSWAGSAATSAAVAECFGLTAPCRQEALALFDALPPALDRDQGRRLELENPEDLPISLRLWKLDDRDLAGSAIRQQRGDDLRLVLSDRCLDGRRDPAGIGSDQRHTLDAERGPGLSHGAEDLGGVHFRIPLHPAHSPPHPLQPLQPLPCWIYRRFLRRRYPLQPTPHPLQPLQPTPENRAL